MNTVCREYRNLVVLNSDLNRLHYSSYIRHATLKHHNLDIDSIDSVTVITLLPYSLSALASILDGRATVEGRGPHSVPRGGDLPGRNYSRNSEDARGEIHDTRGTVGVR